jgi:3-hydroxyacyl-CoA dehydrogenase
VVRPPGVLLLADIKRGGQPLAKNAAASLWDIGDDVVCLEFTSKMNALDPDIMALIDQAIAMGTSGAFKALVI